MDTQQWGPSGWKLLHAIALCCDEMNCNKQIIRGFFSTIKHVLPCIYCRRSYSQYMKELKIKESSSYFRWLYHIHNKVNDKLWKQGYNDAKNPSYQEVVEFYQRYVKRITNDKMEGWDFLYAIIFNYPPHDVDISQIRYEAYIKFFTYLQYFLPCESNREIYQSYIHSHPIEEHMKTREELIKWFYGLEKKINKKCCSYKERCKKIENFRVSSCTGNSCRKSKK